jgi:hypothetical protein
MKRGTRPLAITDSERDETSSRLQAGAKPSCGGAVPRHFLADQHRCGRSLAR